MTDRTNQGEIHRGKVAVITGGGRGFGQAFGTALAARGAHVVLADIDAAAAEAAAAEIAGHGRERVRLRPATWPTRRASRR